LVVPYLNVQSMADAIQELINDPQLREKMGARAREKVEQRYDVSIGGEVIANIVKRYL